MHQAKNGNIYYTLTNIETRGITLGLGSSNRIIGSVGDDESVAFSFDTIVNNCPDKYSNIRFWKATDYGPNRWQIDSEVRKARSEKRTDMVKIVMLVLDCSNSLGSNFKDLKKSAKEFVDILAKSSGNGNIRIGVIGFSNEANTDKNVIPIQNLTKENAKAIKKSIDNLTQHNNTAMYYAIDKAQKMVTDYFSQLDLTDDQKFGGVIMVTFTDGFDNHSLLPGRVFRKGLDNPYFIYVRDTAIRQDYTYTHRDVLQADGTRRDVIETYPLESMMLVLKGNDVSESDATYKTVFNSLATDGKPYYAKNFSEVKRKFSDIADMIVSRFEVLKCYVPRAHEGRVRWTFDKPHGFFGVSVGAFGEGTSRMNFGTGGCIGIDFGFPTKDFRAWGGFLNVKPEYSFASSDLITHVQFGALYAGSCFQYQKAPLLGIGMDIRSYSDSYYSSSRKYEYSDGIGFGLVLRGGIISQKHIYCFADLTLGYYGKKKYERDNYGHYKYIETMPAIYYSLGLNVGFKF